MAQQAGRTEGSQAASGASFTPSVNLNGPEEIGGVGVDTVLSHCLLLINLTRGWLTQPAAPHHSNLILAVTQYHFCCNILSVVLGERRKKGREKRGREERKRRREGEKERARERERKEGKEGERREEREEGRESFIHLLIYFPCGHSSMGWARLKFRI